MSEKHPKLKALEREKIVYYVLGAFGLSTSIVIQGMKYFDARDSFYVLLLTILLVQSNLQMINLRAKLIKNGIDDE